MINHQIICDVCGSVGTESRGKHREKLHIMRARLKMIGWEVSARGGRDFCPNCQPNKQITIQRIGND